MDEEQRLRWLQGETSKACAGPNSRFVLLFGSGSSMRPVSRAAFKAVVPHLRGAGGGFDSHELPPNRLGQ